MTIINLRGVITFRKGGRWQKIITCFYSIFIELLQKNKEKMNKIKNEVLMARAICICLQ